MSLRVRAFLGRMLRDFVSHLSLRKFKLPLCRAEQFGGLAGFRRGLFEGRACFLRGQVPQAPRVHRAAQDQSGIGVPFSLVTFSSGKQEKVTSRRATPGLQTLKTSKR